MIVVATLAGWGVFSPAARAAGDGENFGGLPAGPGREEVFFTCQACHSLAVVKQQGLNRDTWDETLTWMIEEQTMEPLESDIRKLILDYLTAHYGRESSKRRR